jgi:hypothetical protein
MARKLSASGEKPSKKKSDKQRVKDTVAEVESARVATTDTKKDFFAQARDAKADLDEAAAKARAAAQERNKKHGAYRAILKEAAKAGVNSEALAEALTVIIPQDPVQFARHVKAVNEFLVIAEYPLEPGTGQYGLFADGSTVSSAVDQAKLDASDDDIETAKEKGTIAGKTGVNKNPYPEGSREHTLYEVAFQDAQDELKATAFRGNGNGAEAQAAAH